MYYTAPFVYVVWDNSEEIQSYRSKIFEAMGSCAVTRLNNPDINIHLHVSLKDQSSLILNCIKDFSSKYNVDIYFFNIDDYEEYNGSFFINSARIDICKQYDSFFYLDSDLYAIKKIDQSFFNTIKYSDKVLFYMGGNTAKGDEFPFSSLEELSVEIDSNPYVINFGFFGCSNKANFYKFEYINKKRRYLYKKKYEFIFNFNEKILTRDYIRGFYNGIIDPVFVKENKYCISQPQNTFEQGSLKIVYDGHGISSVEGVGIEHPFIHNLHYCKKDKRMPFYCDMKQNLIIESPRSDIIIEGEDYHLNLEFIKIINKIILSRKLNLKKISIVGNLFSNKLNWIKSNYDTYFFENLYEFSNSEAVGYIDLLIVDLGVIYSFSQDQYFSKIKEKTSFPILGVKKEKIWEI